MSNDLNNSNVKYQKPVRRHRIQSLWQIWVPLIVLFLILTGFFVAALFFSETGALDLGLMENTAIILMIIPVALIGVLTLIALVLTIVGTSQVMKYIPRLRLISMQVDSIATGITTWSNRLMLPFVVVSRVKARLSPGRKKSQYE